MKLPPATHRLPFPLRGLYAWVEIDGEPLRVYGANTEDKVSSGYVEVEEGQEFSVRWAEQRKTPPSDDYSMDLSLDGEFVAGAYRGKEDNIFSHENEDGTHTESEPLDSNLRLCAWKGVETSADSQRPFRFGKLTRSPDKTNSRRDQDSATGTIRISYHRVCAAAEGEAHPFASPPLNQPLFEEDKPAAGVSLKIEYGEETELEANGWSSLQYFDESPIGEVVFHYRSRGFLPGDNSVQAAPRSSRRERSQGVPPPVVNKSAPLGTPSPSPPRASTSAARIDDDEEEENDTEELDDMRKLAELARLELDCQKQIADLKSKMASKRKAGAQSAEDEHSEGGAGNAGIQVKKVRRQDGGAKKVDKGKGKARDMEEIDLTADWDGV